MVEYESAQLDVVFQALSDGTRRRMLRSLSLQPRHPHGLVARLVFPQRAPVAAAGATGAQPAGAGAGEP